MTAMMHAWDLTPKEAIELQRDLAPYVVEHDQLGDIETVAGVDVSYCQESDRLAAAACVIDVRTGAMIDHALVFGRPCFPYIPGLFSFRELPPVLDALARLAAQPDLIICDGQGRAHPRRFGLACHLGVCLDLPVIGCAKTRLTGRHEMPANERGARAALLDRDEVIGAVLRTRAGVAPVYVSVGHRVSLDTACAWVMRLSPRYRLPETTRLADQMVGDALRSRA